MCVFQSAFSTVAGTWNQRPDTALLLVSFAGVSHRERCDDVWTSKYAKDGTTDLGQKLVTLQT